jgi:hypothetical protein
MQPNRFATILEYSPLNVDHFATVQQQHRHPSKTSEQYTFISTKEVLDAFAAFGWYPATVVEARVKKPENRGFQAHLIRLQHAELRSKDAAPEILMKHSHNGQSSLHLYSGLLEFVCGNGLVVWREVQDRLTIPHVGDAALFIEGAVRRFTASIPATFEQRERWRGIRLQRDEQLAFADLAILLRFDQRAVEVDPAELLTPRRWEQAEPTLWNVYNTLQENILRGGVRQVRCDGRRFRSRAVRNIDQDLRINRELWRIAQELEKAVQ